MRRRVWTSDFQDARENDRRMLTICENVLTHEVSSEGNSAVGTGELHDKEKEEDDAACKTSEAGETSGRPWPPWAGKMRGTR